MSVTLIKRASLSSWILVALLTAPVVVALEETAAKKAANNSEAFWRWFDEFADAQGEVLDPADYALMNSQQQALNTSLSKREGIASDDREKEPKP